MQYSAFTAQVVACIRDTYGTEPEFLWAKTPNNAAFRHWRNKKWFAALLLDVPRKTLGLPGAGQVDILDVKCDPRMIGSLLDGKGYLPGYHMNKEHWITLVLDGSVPLEQVCALIGLSYELCGKK